MNKKKTRKGFTLVELLVVIAILAILATVSIVGYTSFTKKAQESNDISLTTQMNVALQANEAVEGKAKTMSDALSVLKENGFDVTKLTPTSQGYSYVYDSASGKMLLVDKDYQVVSPENATDTNKYDTYAIANPKTKNVSDLVNAGYGIYLPSDYELDNNSLTVNKAVYVDASALELTNLKLEDTTSNNSIVLSLNAEKTEINVPNGSVDLYGEVVTATSKTADNSLHVYGKVLQLELLKGRVVAMTGSTINTIDASKTTENVQIKKDGGEIGAIVKVSSATNVTLDFSLNEVVVDSTKVQDGFAGGVGSESSPYLISNEEEFSKINSLNNKMLNGEKYHFALLNDIIIDDTYKVVIGANDQFIIENFRGSLDGNNHSLYVQTRHTNYTSATSWFAVFYNLLASEDETTTLKNLNVYFKEMESSWISLSGNVGNTSNPGMVLIESLNFYNEGSILNTLGNNNGLITGYVNSSLSVKNCNNYANMNISGVSGVWVGAIYGPSLLEGSQSSSISFTNVNNYASISGASLSYFNGNSSYIEPNHFYSLEDHVVVTNSYNYGSIFKFSSSDLTLFGSVKGDNLTFDKNVQANFNQQGGISRNILSTGKITYATSDNGKMSITKSDDLSIVTYQVKYTSHYSSKLTSQNGGFSFTFDLDKDSEYLYKAKFATVTDNNFDDYDIIKNVSENNPTNIPFSVATKNGQTYFVINDLFNYLPYANVEDVTLGGTTIQIFGLNENGDIVDYTVVK